MTSIELFRKTEQSTDVPPDWGTGKLDNEDLWIPRGPTWQTSGLPRGHNYQSTALHLSNVRDNDELVPKPQDVDITHKFINKSFPSEHPYASHMERVAMIPTFDSPNDPKRGVAARGQQPISDEMPANAYETTIVKKIKGFPYRHEIQQLPTEGKKQALTWQGEDYFDQQSKIHGNKTQFYPIPPKQLAPNLQDRPPHLQLTERSANVLRNIERNQWIPSQKLDYTGLGPANPMTLDNLDCKKTHLFNTGTPDDSLYPRSVNTFDPARPMEGRLRKLFAPKLSPQPMIASGMKDNPNYQRKMTLTEREEDRLLNGREYVNLPPDPNDPLKDMRWKDMDTSTRPDPSLERVTSAQRSVRESEEFEVPEYHQKIPAVSGDYLEASKEEMHRKIQGIEAQNRWKVLESGTPDHDVAQLKDKYKMLHGKEMPDTFYRHEGKYNEERAGLYKTSYDPTRLSHAMSIQDKSGANMFNSSMSHVEASQYATIPWDENEAALNQSRTVVFKNSGLSGDRPSTSDMLHPYRETVALQRASLQPSLATAGPRTQEGEFVLREDEYGDNYNTKKFLQENKLDAQIRSEPSDLISHQNQNLERTRERVAPRGGKVSPGTRRSVHFSDNVDVQNFHENFPMQIGNSHTAPLTCAEQDELQRTFGTPALSMATTALQTHPEQENTVRIVGDARNLSEDLVKHRPIPTVVSRNTKPIYRSVDVSFSRNPQLKPKPLSETTDVFRSLSTNFMPTGLSCDMPYRTMSSTHFPRHNLAEKKDRRFSWEPGTGRPRPQSCLLDMQDNFIKSEVRKRFHATYKENNPEIRMNINTGHKKDCLLSQHTLLKLSLSKCEQAEKLPMTIIMPAKTTPLPEKKHAKFSYIQSTMTDFGGAGDENLDTDFDK